MPTEQFVIDVNSPPCDPTKADQCRNPDVYSWSLSQGKPDVAANPSPDCAFFVPLVVAAGLVKGFEWLAKRKRAVSLRGDVTYSDT